MLSGGSIVCPLCVYVVVVAIARPLINYGFLILFSSCVFNRNWQPRWEFVCICARKISSPKTKTLLAKCAFIHHNRILFGRPELCDNTEINHLDFLWTCTDTRKQVGEATSPAPPSYRESS